MLRAVVCTTAALVLAAGLGGCTSGKRSPSADSSSAAALNSTRAAKGEGSATVNLATGQRKFLVTCVKGGATTQAMGNEGPDALTLTVVGTPVSAVVVSHGADGTTTIYQAIEGLRDDSGKVAGSIAVSRAGDSYSGTATFVLTKIDAKGARVRLNAGSTSAGSFHLSCGNGYAAPPTLPPSQARPISSPARPISSASATRS